MRERIRSGPCAQMPVSGARGFPSCAASSRQHRQPAVLPFGTKFAKAICKGCPGAATLGKHRERAVFQGERAKFREMKQAHRLHAWVFGTWSIIPIWLNSCKRDTSFGSQEGGVLLRSLRN